MSCQAFREAILEGTGGLLTPEERSPPSQLHSSHLVECPACRAFAAQQERTVQQVVKGLRLLAEADAGAEAPEAVEAHLLAAFEVQRTVLVGPPNGWWGARGRRPFFLVGSAVAALLLLASLPLVERLRPSGRHVSSLPTLGTVRHGTPTPLGESPRLIVSTGEDGRQAQPSRSVRREQRSTAVMPPPKAPVPGQLAGGKAARREDLEPDEEWVTDFIPLNAGQSLFPIERGRMIRTVVPRSLLGTFGLSVHPDWAMVPIKADIVIGEDGAAQAVRFVRNEP